MLIPNFEFSSHALDMLHERDIPQEWVVLTLDSPDYTEIGNDNNLPYIKSIPEFGGPVFHVVVNPNRTPNRIVTFFFDRRLRMAK